MIKEITKLAVRASDRLGYYVVKRDWYVKVDGCEFKVPAGFEFDGDSVPRLPIIYWLTKTASGLKRPLSMTGFITVRWSAAKRRIVCT